MKNIIKKLIFRRPIRILACLLLLLISAAFFIASITEYSIVTEQIDASSAYYRQTGYLDAAGQENSSAQVLDPAVVERIRSSEWVAYVNEAIPYRAVLPQIKTYTEHFSGSIYGANTVYLTGRLLEKEKNYSDFRMKTEYIDDSCQEIEIKTFDRADSVVIEIVEIIAGEGERLPLPAMRFDVVGTEAELDAFYEEATIGTQYLFKIELGLEPEGIVQSGDLAVIDGTDSRLYPLPENGQLDWESGELAEVARAIERLEQDLHMYRVIASLDMSILPEMQNRNFYLTDGRMLHYSDTEEKRPVCVISRTAAVDQGLQVGDVVSVCVGNDISAQLQRTLALNDSGRWEKWEAAEKTTLDLEIVGIVDSSIWDGGYAELFALNLYIPESLLPDEWKMANTDCQLAENEFSFVLNSPEDVEPFLEETAKYVGTFGVQIVLEECGWSDFMAIAEEMRQGNGIGIAVFSLVLMATQCIVLVILYRFAKKEMMIMRLLGVPSKEVRRQFWTAAGIPGITAITAGGVIAYFYSKAALRDSFAVLDDLPGGAMTPQMGVVAGAVGVVLGLFLLLMLVEYRLFWGKSVMEQMQAANKE